MQTFDGLDEFERAVGTHLGHSRWRTVTQEQVDLFADTTDDHQWIHVDPERAARGPFGSTVAHGFLTLALLPSMVREIYRVEGMAMVVNYGSDRVRFPHPTPVGARIRAGAELTRLDPGPQGALAMVTTTVEIEGVAKPACVSDSLFLLRPGKDAS